MTCATCRHFVQHSRDDRAVGARVQLPTGRCTRFPPQAFLDRRVDRVATAWPVTRKEDRCGEYAAREMPQARDVTGDEP